MLCRFVMQMNMRQRATLFVSVYPRHNRNVDSSGLSNRRLNQHCLKKKSRHRWLQSHLVSALSSWSHLPLELCNQISVYLVGEYSLILAENLWRKHPSTSTRFGVTSTLYVTYTYLEGNVYIATLTNAPQTTDRHILYDPSTHPPANLIYIQEDHLGIRKVVFASLKDAPPNAQRSPGLWWHTLVIPEQDCIFTTKSDVSL